MITDAYPKGTSPQLGILEKFKISPHTMVKHQGMALVVPIVGEKGKAWTGRTVSLMHSKFMAPIRRYQDKAMHIA